MALMRRYIDWISIHTEHGSASYALNDDIVTVRTCHGTKSVPLNGCTPASVARTLMRELSIERPDDTAT
jgi:hypothetical protein